MTQETMTPDEIALYNSLREKMKANKAAAKEQKEDFFSPIFEAIDSDGLSGLLALTGGDRVSHTVLDESTGKKVNMTLMIKD